MLHTSQNSHTVWVPCVRAPRAHAQTLLTLGRPRPHKPRRALYPDPCARVVLATGTAAPGACAERESLTSHDHPHGVGRLSSRLPSARLVLRVHLLTALRLRRQLQLPRERLEVNRAVEVDGEELERSRVDEVSVALGVAAGLNDVSLG